MIGHIFKYPIAGSPLAGEVIELKLPKGCAVCDIQAQGGMVCLWAIVDIHAELETRKFKLIGTGWQIDDIEKIYFVKTVQMPEGYVWHVFEVK